jgi:hypothetical protein
MQSSSRFGLTAALILRARQRIVIDKVAAQNVCRHGWCVAEYHRRFHIARTQQPSDRYFAERERLRATDNFSVRSTHQHLR